VLFELPRIERAVREILLAVGEDPDRDGRKSGKVGPDDHDSAARILEWGEGAGALHNLSNVKGQGARVDAAAA
jgi:hypothetical protein